MKALPTEYRGVLYRSRTEARWAAFFDEMGIDAVYEGEGYDLDGVWYLPDFYFPAAKVWFEVKGVDPTSDEIEKARRLASASGRSVVIAIGHPTTDYASFNLLVWARDDHKNVAQELARFCDEGKDLILIAGRDYAPLVQISGSWRDLHGSPEPVECLKAARAVQALRFGT